MISTWNPPRYLAWPKASRLGSGLIFNLLGLLLLGLWLGLPVNAPGPLILEIGEIFRFDAHCALRLLASVWLWMIGGFNHIWFYTGRWSSWVTQSVRLSPLRPACWLPVTEKSRESRSAEVRRVWEIYDERSELIPCDQLYALNAAVNDGDTTLVWKCWSHAAEGSLAGAYELAGGPVPERGLGVGRGAAGFRTVRLGGLVVRKVRARCSYPGDGGQLDLYRDACTAPSVDLRRRFRAVLDVACAIGRSGFSVSRALVLNNQWARVNEMGAKGKVDGAEVPQMVIAITEMHDELDQFLRKVGAFRGDTTVRGRRAWLTEDPLVRPYYWLGPGLNPPSPFSSVILLSHLTLQGSCLILCLLIRSSRGRGFLTSIVQSEGLRTWRTFRRKLKEAGCLFLMLLLSRL